MVLNATQTAEYLKISKWLVYESVKKNEIPYFKVGKAIRFRIEDLDKWIKGVKS